MRPFYRRQHYALFPVCCPLYTVTLPVMSSTILKAYKLALEFHDIIDPVRVVAQALLVSVLISADRFLVSTIRRTGTQLRNIRILRSK